MESLPILDATSLINLHFSLPKTEVIAEGACPGQTFDIETLEPEDLSYDLKMKVAQTSKISITYDIQKIDDMQAAEYLKIVKFYLDDPDMLLLWKRLKIF